MASEQESQLLIRIKSGDQTAWPDYLECIRDSMRAFIQKNMSPTLLRRVDAEDVLQEAFVSCLNSADQMDWSEGDVFGWVCQQARRRIADAGRRAGAQKRDASREISIDAPAGSSSDKQAGIVNLLVASITSPSQAFSRNQKEVKLLSALSKLSEDQQEALRLRYVSGLPTKEIAGKLGKSDGSIRVMLTRSLKKLEELMTDIPE